MSLVLDIRRLSERDICGGFSAGTTPDHVRLNEFFHKYAKQNEKRKASATFVAWAGDTIAGFATIAPGAIDPARVADLVKGLSRHSAPVLVLGRMATDARFQKQGVGSRLMRDVVFARAMEMADGYGCIGVYVDAKPGAISFYTQFGFSTLALVATTAPTPMFLSLKTIRAAASRPHAEGARADAIHP